MNILKGIEDLNRILDVINTTFGVVREENFDFRDIMPKAYGENSNLLKYHYILCDNGVDVAAAGNIPGVISLNQVDYAYSFLGSVATLPQYENKGYMRVLMQDIKSDDIKNKKVFSLLTGARGRYARYGYTKLYSNCFFYFDEYFLKHTAKDNDITIRTYDGEIDRLYELYTSTQPLILRSKEELLPSLGMSRSALRLIEYKGKIVGYYAFCRRKKLYIPELAISDYNLCGKVMRAIFDFEQITNFCVYVNPLNVALRSALDAVCEESVINDELQIRVYDLALFIKMLIELNLFKGILSTEDQQESICIENKIYRITINNGKVSVSIEDSDAYGMNENEFLRSAINNPFSSLKKTSNVFPLAFGISLPDCF